MLKTTPMTNRSKYIMSGPTTFVTVIQLPNDTRGFTASLTHDACLRRGSTRKHNHAERTQATALPTTSTAAIAARLLVNTKESQRPTKDHTPVTTRTATKDLNCWHAANTPCSPAIRITIGKPIDNRKNA